MQKLHFSEKRMADMLHYLVVISYNIINFNIEVYGFSVSTPTIMKSRMSQVLRLQKVTIQSSIFPSRWLAQPVLTLYWLISLLCGETLFTDRVVLYLLSKTQLWQLHENDQSDLIWNDNAMDLLLGYGWLLSDFYYIRGSQHIKAYFGFSCFRYSVFKSLVSNMPSISLWSHSDCDEHEITTK